MARGRAARECLDDDHAAAATWTCPLVVIGSIGGFALGLWPGEQFAGARNTCCRSCCARSVTRRLKFCHFSRVSCRGSIGKSCSSIRKLWCPSNRWSGRAGALCTNNRSHPFLRPGFEHHVEGPLRGASNMAEAAALLQHLGQLRLSRLGAETLADLLRE